MMGGSRVMLGEGACGCYMFFCFKYVISLKE